MTACALICGSTDRAPVGICLLMVLDFLSTIELITRPRSSGRLNCLNEIQFKIRSGSVFFPILSPVYLVFIVLLAVCPGCSTVGEHWLYSRKNPVYSGTRADLRIMAHKNLIDELPLTPVWSTIDLPFSFVADALYLPFDLEQWWERSTPDPLVGWTFHAFPVGGRLRSVVTNTLDKAIVDDYQAYIAKNKLDVTDEILGYYEDRTGQRAVKFGAYVSDEAGWNFVLIYDRQNRRVKVVKFDRTKSVSIM